MAEAALRNSVTLTEETAFVLSAPATALARTLGLLGARELFERRVRRLVIVDTGEPHADAPALRTLIAEWPTPVILCGRDVGEALPFPGASVDRDFAWTEAHPVADAYRAYRPMPYDAPSYDLAAVHYASQPESGFFRLSDPGTAAVDDGGRLTFSEGGGGTIQRLVLDPTTRNEALDALVSLRTPVEIRWPPLATDASRRAALLVAHILPVCSLLAPCRAGASAPKLATLFRPGPLRAPSPSPRRAGAVAPSDRL